MNTYESPTIEQVGGSNNHNEPDGLPIPVALNVVAVFVAAVWAVAILWSKTWTWNNLA